MIYFDNASAAPLSEAARLSYDVAAAAYFSNPSSPHALGIEAERAVRNAAYDTARLLSCQSDEIIFTSGATESNNTAILGAALCRKRQGGHLITTPYEHPSVLRPMRFLSEQGFTITYAHPSEWVSLLRDDTFFVSCAQINHETGDDPGAPDILAAVKKMNPRVITHMDGAQGFGKLETDLSSVDLYTFSAHKIHGPKGVGGLMARKGVRLIPLMYGGDQQETRRPGTENVPGILAMSAAASDAVSHQAERLAAVSAVKNKLSSLAGELQDVIINHRGPSVSPYILNMSFLGVKGAVLVNALSGMCICTATGAACRVRKNKTSPLAAMGFESARADSAVRFSFSHLNTAEEADAVKTAVASCVASLRRA